MTDYLNTVSDLGFVLLILAILFTLYSLMLMLRYVLRGTGFSFLAPTLAAAAWIALHFWG